MGFLLARLGHAYSLLGYISDKLGLACEKFFVFVFLIKLAPGPH